MTRLPSGCVWGAIELIAQAVEAELQALHDIHVQRSLPDGSSAVGRNGYLPERTILTGIGNVDIKVPKVRDRSGSGIHFTCVLLPPYLKGCKSIEELLPWMFLRGISTGYNQEVMGRCSVTGPRGCRPTPSPA